MISLNWCTHTFWRCPGEVCVWWNCGTSVCLRRPCTTWNSTPAPVTPATRGQRSVRPNTAPPSTGRSPHSRPLMNNREHVTIKHLYLCTSICFVLYEIIATIFNITKEQWNGMRLYHSKSRSKYDMIKTILLAVMPVRNVSLVDQVFSWIPKSRKLLWNNIYFEKRISKIELYWKCFWLCLVLYIYKLCNHNLKAHLKCKYFPDENTTITTTTNNNNTNIKSNIYIKYYI